MYTDITFNIEMYVLHHYGHIDTVISVIPFDENFELTFLDKTGLESFMTISNEVALEMVNSYATFYDRELV